MLLQIPDGYSLCTYPKPLPGEPERVAGTLQSVGQGEYCHIVKQEPLEAPVGVEEALQETSAEALLCLKLESGPVVQSPVVKSPVRERRTRQRRADKAIQCGPSDCAGLLHCGTCPFVTRYPSALEKHLRTHPKGPMKCNLCSSTFSTTKQLRAHMRSHTATKGIFQCKQCSFSAASRHYLYKHKMEKHAKLSLMYLD